MGTFSSWSYTGRCTVWQPTLDLYGQPTGYVRTVFACSFKAGGTLVSGDQGEQFLSKSHVYLEANKGSQPLVGSYLITEESVDEVPPDSAEVIRMVMQQDPSLFDEGLPDWEIVTG